MSASVLIWMISSFRWDIWFKVILFFLKSSGMYGIVVFIVCCHFISLYYLPREGQSLLLQAVQKALPRLILSFCKDNHFFWESILLLLFFFSFSLPRLSHSLPWLLHSVPWLLHSLPRLSHSVPRLSHSLPWFCCHIPLSNVCPTHPTCRGRSFKKMPGVLKLLPLQGALLIALYPGRCPGLWASAPSGRAACVFCPANCLIPRALPWAVSFCPFYYICTWKNKEVKIFISANYC